MSVSTAPGGHNSFLDPRDIQLDASRLSAYSHISNTSGVVLGGVEYPVGSRVGKSKQFIIGDPSTFEPLSFNTSRSTIASGATSKKDLETEPIESRGYAFEDWNWQIIRLCCFIVYVGTMVLLLAVTIGISVEHNQTCESVFKWWQGSVIYSIPVAYFRDTDDNNLGDLEGLHEKLDYVDFLKTKVISLTHVLPSEAPMFEKYTSFTGVDQRLGNVEQLQQAIKRAHDDLKVKVMLEISPVATSKQHPWFWGSTQNSASYQSRYDVFYIWRTQPDRSLNGGWEFDIYRNQYYFHYNDSSQPVLLWSNHKVQEDFVEVLRYWLDQGVDGFVIRNMHRMLAYTNSDLVDAVEQWRELLDERSAEYKEKVLMGGGRVCGQAEGGERRAGVTTAAYAEYKKKVLMVEDAFVDKLKAESEELVPRLLRSVHLVQADLSIVHNATHNLKRQVQRGLSYTNQLSGPWTSWRVTGLSPVEPISRTTLQMLCLMLPGTPFLVSGQEVGMLYLEEPFNPINPPEAMLWKLEDIFPYHAGIYPQNLTTIRALQKVIVERQKAVTLRLDSVVDELQGNAEKNFNYEFTDLRFQWFLLGRTYMRRDAYYYAGNYYHEDIEGLDFSHVSPEANIVSDNFEKYKNRQNLMEMKLLRGHGLVFKVTY